MPRKIRHIRVEGQLAYIPLTQGHEAVIDAADVYLVDGHLWYANRYRKTFYAVRSAIMDGKKVTVYLHRVIMGDPDTEVDHVNGDGLDDRRTNLREATRAQNQSNKALQANNKSGFKGVSPYKETGLWQACIKKANRTQHLGFFDTPESAHAAYCEASARLHGEFGRTQ